MIIVICGLRGTGKTTISKKLCQTLRWNYLNDWELSKNQSLTIDSINSFLTENYSNNIVLDLDYENFTGTDLINLISNKNIKCYYLGYQIEAKQLATKFDQLTARKFISLSCNYRRESRKYIKNFFDITEQRDDDIHKIYLKILSDLKDVL